MLTRLGEAASFETVEAEVKHVGTRARVATPRALYRLKRDTVRPLDRQSRRTAVKSLFTTDAEALRLRFGLTVED